MIRSLAFSVGAAVALSWTNPPPSPDPIEALIQWKNALVEQVRVLQEENTQLRALVQMQSLTPLTTPSHLRARDMGDDTWWLTTDTNHFFVMIGTNGSKIILQHK